MRACQEHPGNLQCWLQLSSVHAARHEPELAVEAARRAVSCAPTDARAHDGLSRAYQTQAEEFRPHTAYDPASALASADEAVRLAPGTVQFHNTRAWALTLLKRWKEVEREYRAILSMDPGNFRALNGLGWRHRRWRPILAARYYERAAAVNPQSEVIKINLKGAIRSWIHQMTWIWACGGLALGVFRWALPEQAVRVGVAGPALSCTVGTVMMVRHVPRGSMALLRKVELNPLAPIAGRLVVFAGIAGLAALGPERVSMGATALLALLTLVEWKVDFIDLDRRLVTRVRRAAPDG